MGEFRNALPQLTDKVCITDGGLETDLLFNHQIELPEFAAYHLLKEESGYSTLYEYYKIYAELANRYQVGLILETPTWRANLDWGSKIGDSADSLHNINLNSVKLIEQIRHQYGSHASPIVISGCIGPRGDGYSPENMMTVEQAQNYHSRQVGSFAETNVDMLCALTLNYVEEAVGVALAAQQAKLPLSISFTVETDGRLPTGDSLKDAINSVDDATDAAPIYYMINCSHPTHFDHLFAKDEAWLSRIRGVRGNASCLSHQELDESEVLHDGDPHEFGEQLNQLKSKLPSLSVLGGCCGTDTRHIEAICRNM